MRILKSVHFLHMVRLQPERGCGLLVAMGLRTEINFSVRAQRSSPRKGCRHNSDAGTSPKTFIWTTKFSGNTWDAASYWTLNMRCSYNILFLGWYRRWKKSGMRLGAMVGGKEKDQNIHSNLIHVYLEISPIILNRACS